MYIHTVYIYTESTAAKAKYVKELLVSSKKTQQLFRSREEWKQKMEHRDLKSGVA